MGLLTPVKVVLFLQQLQSSTRAPSITTREKRMFQLAALYKSRCPDNARYTCIPRWRRPVTLALRSFNVDRMQSSSTLTEHWSTACHLESFHRFAFREGILLTYREGL